MWTYKAKTYPTTIAHNIDGLDELQGAHAPRTSVEGKRQEKTMEERMAESSTWATWAPGSPAAMVEGCGDSLPRTKGAVASLGHRAMQSATCGPEYGARQQLSLPRCQRNGGGIL